MKVVSAEQMRQADAAAIASGIPSLVLMENAAYALLRNLESRFTPLARQRIAIFCGKGNNGGDGLALARLLHVHHRPASLAVILAYPLEDLSPDAAAQLRMLEALDVPYTMRVPADIAATTLAIDALLGTGTSGNLRDPLTSLVEQINALPLAKRVAVDVPSAFAVKADLTISFAAPKIDQVLPPTCDRLGELVIADIGIPSRFFADTNLNLTTVADLPHIAKPRDRASHKGSFGHVALLGGAAGKHGALQMSGQSALLVGAGYATLFSPDPSFETGLPDLMRGNWHGMPRDLESKSVLAIGPGLGDGTGMTDLVQGLYRHWPAPLVIDADALNILAPLNEAHGSRHARVLTPHPGEMKRLLGREVSDRVEDARGFSQTTGCIVVLKGQRSIVAFPDGQCWVNPTGSPALAKAGSGDVLTGLLTGLLSQYKDHQREAILAAVYLHGRCGELAAKHAHEMTSLASRLCDYLPEALGELA